ncbi:GMC family oxidoreductase [Novosphingopyxis iocasae]|uniref:GMC family oxidoreductase n=1 Tax=Novosphingopyxis iocasae TaxID=2762729 RepID=UPI001650EA19|nr:GMC family oxidoreductase N-terminal domain-containing protein [Novosphingopyxis iocasae]
MQEFDVIVVGGGSAGSAVAGRLSEDPARSVCLIEAGGTNDDWRVKTPGMMPFLPDNTNWHYSTIPQKGLNGRMGHQPRGRGMGGSSAINAMLYIRGNSWDYDNWAAMGCTGWAYEDVLPYFKRSESNERGGNAFHGGDGPLSVSDQHSVNPGSKAFVESAARLQMPLNEDFNGARQAGFGIYQTTTKGGERWTASRAYIDPVRSRENLHVLTGALTEKLIVENGRVTGVRIQRGGETQTLRARGAVVLSAGAFGSPHILQLSGIGPAEHLRYHSIDVVLDKPSVGENLQDHIDYVASFETRSRDFIGDSLTGTLKMARAMVEHRLRRTGIMTTPYAEAGGFWSADSDAPAPQIQYHFVPAMLEDHGREKVKGHGFSCHACVLRPESKGSVRLKSNEPGDMPAIDPAFLEDDRDIALLRAGVRQMYRIFETTPLAEYQMRDRHPVDLDDDDALDEMLRDRSDTVYHPVGSCAMGPDDADVLTPRLKFRGLEGLYIADASVMPKIVSGNTNAPSIMIGERCADFLREDLRG